MKEWTDNYQAAEEYKKMWSSRSRSDTFECFYNTADYQDVIAEKVYSQSDVIHSMLWPSVVIVICCAVFLRIETRRRHLTFCGRRSPPCESSAAVVVGAVGSRCATPERRDVRVVVVRSSSSAGRFPGPNGSPVSRLVSRAGVDVKPWKSYSSLEQMPSSRSSEPRDLGKNENKRAARAAVVRPATSSPKGDELKVARDERKLSLTIPGEQYRAKVQQFPRGSCDL